METMIKEKNTDTKDTIRVYDPFDNSVVGEVKNGTKKDALIAIENAVKGFEIGDLPDE